MAKLPDSDFFNQIDYPNIIENIKGVYTSDGSMNVLLDYERILDEADLYAFKNWEFGELVDGPKSKKYNVVCIFMWPEQLMPDPRGGLRLINLGCRIHFKKTTIKVPVKIESQMDFQKGTHYPKMKKIFVWLVRIEIPKELMNDIAEGSIDLAGQTVDLDDLDEAYDNDLDKEGTEQDQADSGQNQGMGMDQIPNGPMTPPGAPGQPGGGF